MATPKKFDDDAVSFDYGALMRDLADAEGFKPTLYKDTKGNDTIGHGINLTAAPLTDAELGMLRQNRPHLETRDLKKDGISEDESAMLMLNRIREAEGGLDRNLYWWRGASDKQQRALVELAYTHGVSGALGYKKLLAAGESGDFNVAAHEMTRSTFAKETPDRARRMAENLQDFDPEGPGYDYVGARSAGLRRGKDGHMGSVRPATKGEMAEYDLPKGSFVLLKGASHETFGKAVAAEEALGREVIRAGGRYFAVPPLKGDSGDDNLQEEDVSAMHRIHPEDNIQEKGAGEIKSEEEVLKEEERASESRKPFVVPGTNTWDKGVVGPGANELALPPRGIKNQPPTTEPDGEAWEIDNILRGLEDGSITKEEAKRVLQEWGAKKREDRKLPAGQKKAGLIRKSAARPKVA